MIGVEKLFITERGNLSKIRRCALTFSQTLRRESNTNRNLYIKDEEKT